MRKTILIIILLVVMIASCFAFVGCEKPSEGLLYKLTPDGEAYYVLGIGSCTDEKIVIPSTYEEKPVIIISNEAFRGCSDLVSVTIPDSITHIATDAFSNCSKLKSVIFKKGSKLDSIYSRAFSNCTSLTSITIPNSVTSIGSYAFEDCAKLSKVTFEKDSKLTSINSHAFAGCTSLTSIKIPKGVTSIDYATFSGCYSLTSVSIPEGVTSIGTFAFMGCSGLANITIPSSVIDIGNAFIECTSLQDIVVDANNQIYQSIDGNLYSKDGKTLVLYAPGKTDKSFAIPSGVTRLGASVFYGCTNLSSITIPRSLTNVSAYAFLGSTGLTSIVVEENHSHYKSIDGNLYSRDGKTLILYAPGKTDKSFTIPSGVTRIGSSAFEGCTSIVNVTIPSSVTSIGNFAFYGCANLATVTFEDPNGWFVTRTKGAASGTSLTLTDASQNVTYLTDRYYDWHWYKS